ncbi:hypothetical protein [Pseudomonas poae]|uniref:hypothetical protein n=1 Tax=Pseudomonas poae TaxID=200451 RepID=UPI0030CA8EE1
MADTFGLKVISDSGSISLDSEFSRLCTFHKGTYSSGVSFSFQQTVTTQEPPLVFVRPNNNGSFIQLGVALIGSAGAWTGATVVGSTSHSGSIFVAAFASKSTASYGMRLWDATGKLIFDSGMQVVVFTRVAQNWTYTNTTQDVQGFITNWYSIPLNYGLGDYFMINNARMPMMGGNNRQRTTGLRFDFAAGVLRFSVTSITNPTYFRLQAIFGKLGV